MGGMTRKGPVDLSGMDRSFFEALSPEARVELLCRLHALAIEQAEKLARASTNSSRPPSSDGPFGPASGPPTGTIPPLPPASPPATTPEPPSRSGRKAGKQRGSEGIWRCEALEAERDENHYPTLCATCGMPFEMWDRQTGHSAHFVLDLERTTGGIRIACVRHRYHAIECACGTAAQPGVGVLSTVPGRSRDLLLSEACLPPWPPSSQPCRCAITYHALRSASSWPSGLACRSRSARSTAASARSASPASRWSRL